MDGSNTHGKDAPEGRREQLRRRLREWRLHQHVARGMAYGVGSGAVSLIIVWVQTRY
ncbi:hypothetical protein OOK58_59250 [Streptomyces sp. NBC_01728]|uniref:hypothetical protein n=1 Tax=unclassified Streptomyces TaxID=2593676 RepID=UPI00224FFD80|nr:MULTISPECIES: hypothetical protein [unclassified Streptomyces]MCX4462448.1 hypothetical protein [Streptomyces sp. NBC_01719]MCX4500878.1 hypothetical protein [Streptomyces sp. NBC_01728]